MPRRTANSCCQIFVTVCVVLLFRADKQNIRQLNWAPFLKACTTHSEVRTQVRSVGKTFRVNAWQKMARRETRGTLLPETTIFHVTESLPWCELVLLLLSSFFFSWNVLLFHADKQNIPQLNWAPFLKTYKVIPPRVESCEWRTQIA